MECPGLPTNVTRRGRRNLAAAGAVLGLLLVAGGCGGSPKGPPTVDAIRRRGKLVVGVRFDPGLALRNPRTGDYDGFNVRVAKAVALGIFGGRPETIGDRIEFVDTELANREADLQNGIVDIEVANFTINDARKQTVDFAGPYLIDHQDIMVTSGDTSIRGVGDLNAKRVCSATGSTSAATLATQAPQAQLTLLDTAIECGQALGAGSVDAVSTDESVLAGVVASGAGAFKVVGAPFSDEPWGIGLARGDETFRSFLNDQLDAMVRRGDWTRAFSETLGQLGLKTPPPPAVDRYRGTPAAAVTTSTVA